MTDQIIRSTDLSLVTPYLRDRVTTAVAKVNDAYSGKGVELRCFESWLNRAGCVDAYLRGMSQIDCVRSWPGHLYKPTWAVDYVAYDAHGWSWDSKYLPVYEMYGSLVVDAGLTWGGNWPSLRDLVHAELTHETRWKMIQGLLQAVGCDCGPVDGVPGDRTHQAVYAFNTANNLRSDELCSPETWAALVAGAGLQATALLGG